MMLMDSHPGSTAPNNMAQTATAQSKPQQQQQNGYTPAMCDFSLVHLPPNSSVYTALKTFSDTFDKPHTYLSILICILGTGCNLCNITVLTRRSMRTAVNTILCAIASCDTVVMLSNLVFISHYNLEASNNCGPSSWSRNWSLFAYLHSQLALIGHSSSIWLSVMMGRLRYNTLRSHGGQIRSRKPSSEMAQAYASIVFVLVLVTVFNVPNCLSYTIQEIPMFIFCGVEEWANDNSTFGYMPSISEMAVARGCLLFRLAFWISGVLFKVIPCMLLTIFMVVLVRILSEVKKRRARLMEGKKSSGKEDTTDRTTRMLITVICVFLATELPQGFMSVATGIFSREFQMHIYQNLGDVLDLLSLINSCSTFVIYCTMSKQYRTEFGRIFLPARLCSGGQSRRRTRPNHRGGWTGTDENNGTEMTFDDGCSTTLVDNPSVMPLRKRFQVELRKNSAYRKISEGWPMLRKSSMIETTETMGRSLIAINETPASAQPPTSTALNQKDRKFSESGCYPAAATSPFLHNSNAANIIVPPLRKGSNNSNNVGPVIENSSRTQKYVTSGNNDNSNNNSNKLLAGYGGALRKLTNSTVEEEGEEVLAAASTAAVAAESSSIRSNSTAAVAAESSSIRIQEEEEEEEYETEAEEENRHLIDLTCPSTTIILPTTTNNSISSCHLSPTNHNSISCHSPPSTSALHTPDHDDDKRTDVESNRSGPNSSSMILGDDDEEEEESENLTTMQIIDKISATVHTTI